MFRSSTIIRELALNLAKFIFMLNHSLKLRRYLLCGCVVACHGMACVCYTLCMQHTRNFTECFNVNITLARSSERSLMMVLVQNM